VLFGHISRRSRRGTAHRAGPAAQFGYARLIWLVGGVCLAGAVHDTIILWASTRRAALAGRHRAPEIGPVAGTTAASPSSSS
jgi:carbon starvation protein